MDLKFDNNIFFYNYIPLKYILNKQIDKNKVNIYEELKSYRIILKQKIKINHCVKKYIKYSDNINRYLIKTIKQQCDKNTKNLIKYGANIHTNKEKVMIISIVSNNIKIIKILIKNGMIIDTKNNFLLDALCKYGHLDIVKFFNKNNMIKDAQIDLFLIKACEYGI